MNEQLKGLVATHGLEAVLASLRNLVVAEAAELEALDDDADRATVEALEEVGSMILAAAVKYDALTPSV